ncbi:hypothetical protein VTJ49DRAFT_7391 [Mycothermus thermophilus]|uniref:Zn(2)-C6 fungal-type domain-containing protein n=1 Tax=Humicola insolens TaxID=85995 RepID=A0ABR3VIE8_HUMIN
MDGKNTAEQPKRRACDECRGRKLACSKELDGCARCKREGIKCVYSPQKRMGRPKKHRPAEPEERAEASEPQRPLPDVPGPAAIPPALATAPAAPGTIPMSDPQTFIFPDFNFDSTFGMDLDLSFLDMNNMDMNFFDIVDTNSQFLPDATQTSLDQQQLPQPQTQPPPLPQNQHTPTAQKPPNAHRGFWPMAGFADINWDEPANDIAPTPRAPNPEVSCEDIAQIIQLDLSDSLPSLSPPSSGSSSSHASPQSEPVSAAAAAASSSNATTPSSVGTTSTTSNTSQTCCCLSTLLQALTSLQTLPTEVGPALMVTRTATRAAHDAILCPVCSDPPLDLCNQAASIQAMQNMMVLSALLPSLSNAYTRVLDMVDAAAAEADRARHKMRFTVAGYGGLWGWMARMDPVKCKNKEKLEGAVLDPMLWRLTVRALLKVDVYGIDECTPGVEGMEDAHQPGLKTIISLVVERSKKRHEALDALVKAGLIERPAGYKPPEERTEKPACLKIIDLAKQSVESLVIP